MRRAGPTPQALTVAFRVSVEHVTGRALRLSHIIQIFIIFLDTNSHKSSSGSARHPSLAFSHRTPPN